MNTRYLVNHPESDSLFEVFGELELGQACENCCDNVTGIEYWENKFKGEFSMIKKLMTDWLVAKEQEQEANARRFNIECALYKLVMEQTEIRKEGATNFEEDGLKLTITSRYDVKVDQEKAAANPELFVTKYEFSKTFNKGLTPEQIDLQGDMVVVKPGKPTFAIKASI